MIFIKPKRLKEIEFMGFINIQRSLCHGRARDYTDEMNQKLRESILKIVKGEFGRDNLLIVTDLDFGHTDPQWVLPLGIKMQLNPINREIRLLESATQ